MSQELKTKWPWICPNLWSWSQTKTYFTYSIQNVFFLFSDDKVQLNGKWTKPAPYWKDSGAFNFWQISHLIHLASSPLPVNGVVCFVWQPLPFWCRSNWTLCTSWRIQIHTIDDLQRQGGFQLYPRDRSIWVPRRIIPLHPPPPLQEVPSGSFIYGHTQCPLPNWHAQINYFALLSFWSGKICVIKKGLSRLVSQILCKFNKWISIWSKCCILPWDTFSFEFFSIESIIIAIKGLIYSKSVKNREFLFFINFSLKWKKVPI